MPNAFQESDLVMMDLECFPDGSRASDNDIVKAAMDVSAPAVV